MRVTLKQIGEMAGTTKSTVDKVIHDRPGVSEKKRQEIKRLLKEYGYEANPLAKALNYQKRKMKIAVVLPGVSATEYIRKGMEIVRQDFQSFNIEVEYHKIGGSDAEGQAQCLHGIAQEGVSGIIVMPIRSSIVTDSIRELISLDIPVVIVNSELQLDGTLCYVGQDMFQSGKVAASMLRLFTGGKARIGIISCRNMIGHEQREQSFINYAMEKYPGFSISATKYILETPEDAYRQTMEMFREDPEIDSVFITCGCVTDICHAVRDYRAAVGRETQPVIICYEKYDEILDLVRKNEVACTLAGGLSSQGRISMRLLFEYLVYEQPPEQKNYYFSNDIIICENS